MQPPLNALISGLYFSKSSEETRRRVLVKGRPVEMVKIYPRLIASSKACLVAEGCDIAVFVRPLVHHIEFDISQIHLQLPEHVRHLAVSRIWVAHDHNALVIIDIGIYDAHDHVREHDQFKFLVFQDIKLNIGICWMMTVESKNIFLCYLSDPIDFSLVLKWIPFVMKRFPKNMSSLLSIKISRSINC